MTTTDDNTLFVDTNILICATDDTSPFHRQATETLETIRQAETELVVSIQILREYLAAATRISLQGTGLALADILLNIQTFETEFRVVEDNITVFHTLTGLIPNLRIAGRQIHDANIVATMQTYNIRRLLTHNVADFNRFAGLIIIVPLI